MTNLSNFTAFLLITSTLYIDISNLQKRKKSKSKFYINWFSIWQVPYMLIRGNIKMFKIREQKKLKIERSMCTGQFLKRISLNHYLHRNPLGDGKASRESLIDCCF